MEKENLTLGANETIASLLSRRKKGVKSLVVDLHGRTIQGSDLGLSKLLNLPGYQLEVCNGELDLTMCGQEGATKLQRLSLSHMRITVHSTRPGATAWYAAQRACRAQLLGLAEPGGLVCSMMAVHCPLACEHCRLHVVGPPLPWLCPFALAPGVPMRAVHCQFLNLSHPLGSQGPTLLSHCSLELQAVVLQPRFGAAMMSVHGPGAHLTLADCQVSVQQYPVGPPAGLQGAVDLAADAGGVPSILHVQGRGRLEMQGTTFSVQGGPSLAPLNAVSVADGKAQLTQCDFGVTGVMTIWSPEASLQLQDCSASTSQPRQACVHCSAGRLQAKACRFTAITGAAQSQVAAVLVSGGAAIMQSCKLRADAAVCVVVTGVNGPAVFEASQCDLAFLEQAGEALVLAHSMKPDSRCVMSHCSLQAHDTAPCLLLMPGSTARLEQHCLLLSEAAEAVSIRSASLTATDCLLQRTGLNGPHDVVLSAGMSSHLLLQRCLLRGPPEPAEEMLRRHLGQQGSGCAVAVLAGAEATLEDCGVETLGQACLVEGERSTAQLLRCKLGPHTRRGKWRLGGSIEAVDCVGAKLERDPWEDGGGDQRKGALGAAWVFDVVAWPWACTLYVVQLLALLARTMREALQRHDTYITTDEVLDEALCWQAGPAASGAATAVSDEGSKASCEQGATALAPEPLPIKLQDDTEGGNGAGSRTHVTLTAAGRRTQEAPTASHAPSKPHTCELCGVTDNLRLCQACLSVRYCGVQCQRAHWPKHKTQCKATRSKAT